MAKDVAVPSFSVQPVEDKDGTLKALTIQKMVRVKRVSDDGRMLSYGVSQDIGEPMTVGVGQLADLIRELSDWPIYYASGQSAQDR